MDSESGAKGGIRLLATTALENTWGDGEPLLFLGDWCRLYDRREEWARRSHQVVRNHWDDRDKLRRDHDRLKALHDALLGELSQAMGRHHGVDRSPRYWQMILDPWLLTYVAVVWDRWEALRLAFETHGRLETIAFEPRAPSVPCADYSDFIEKALDDPWNYRLFLEIIEEQYPDLCVIRTAGRGEEAEAPRGAAAGNLKDSAFRCADALLSKIPCRSRAVFYRSYFPPGALLRLNLRLHQAPRWYLNEFRWPKPDGADPGGVRPAGRDDISLGLRPTDAFESFLLRRIVRDIPRAYVEGYAALREKAGKLPLKPRVVLTADAHWGNDFFKVWSAELVHAGAAFIVMTHGGSIPALFESMSFEESIADVKTTWAAPYREKHVQLPSSKLVGGKIHSARESLAVVGGEMPRYAYRAQAAPQGAQTLVGFEMVCDLYSRLAEEPRAWFLVKPYADRGWNTRRRYGDRLGADRVSTEPDLRRFLSRARIVVCTYPETTFLEAMTSGIPAILFYPAHLWERIPEMNPLLETLRRAKILFVDPGLAADHINDVWGVPERWWDGPEASRARREFVRQATGLNGDWLERWGSFVEERIASAG